MLEDKFVAKEMNWQDEDGYQVEQYHNGKMVCSQFVSGRYETGIKPELAE